MQKKEQTHPAHLHAVEKFEKESVNTQNDYKTMSKRRDKKKKKLFSGFCKSV